jgi:hypothetical protein
MAIAADFTASWISGIPKAENNVEHNTRLNATNLLQKSPNIMTTYVFKNAESYHRYAGPFLRVKGFCLLVTMLPNFQTLMACVGFYALPLFCGTDWPYFLPLSYQYRNISSP